jgi:RNA processing factor Prp31
MRALSRYYEEIYEEINTLSNRLHTVIQQSFPELEKLFSIQGSFVFKYCTTISTSRFRQKFIQSSHLKSNKGQYKEKYVAPTCRKERGCSVRSF